MKKASVILILVLLFMPLILNSVLAQETPPGLPSELQKDPEELATELKNKTQTKWDYLKQEWGKILRKNKYLEPIFVFYDKISPIINPISKFIFGLEPSLSWLFFLTIAIWITTLIYILRVFQLTSPFSDWVSWVLSFGFISALGITGAIKYFADKIIYLVSLILIPWIQILIMIGIILTFVILSYFSKPFKKWVEKIKEEKEKEQGKIERKELHETLGWFKRFFK